MLGSRAVNRAETRVRPRARVVPLAPVALSRFCPYTRPRRENPDSRAGLTPIPIAPVRPVREGERAPRRTGSRAAFPAAEAERDGQSKG